MSLSAARPATILAFAAATVVAAFLAFALAAPTATAAQCKGGDRAPSKLNKRQASKAVLCLVNKKRRAAGAKRLKANGKQHEAARKHTRKMVRRRCFSHRCPGERDLQGRLTKSGYLPCNCSWGIGENLAYGKRSKAKPRRIVAAWMNSSGHRANLLNRSFRHIGIGVVWGTPSGGRARRSATYTTTFGYKR